MGGVGAALLGKLADLTDINFVYRVCSFLPLIGILAGWLPTTERTDGGLEARKEPEVTTAPRI